MKIFRVVTMMAAVALASCEEEKAVAPTNLSCTFTATPGSLFNNLLLIESVSVHASALTVRGVKNDSAEISFSQDFPDQYGQLTLSGFDPNQPVQTMIDYGHYKNLRFDLQLIHSNQDLVLRDSIIAGPAPNPGGGSGGGNDGGGDAGGGDGEGSGGGSSGGDGDGGGSGSGGDGGGSGDGDGGNDDDNGGGSGDGDDDDGEEDDDDDDSGDDDDDDDDSGSGGNNGNGNGGANGNGGGNGNGNGNGNGGGNGNGNGGNGNGNGGNGNGNGGNGNGNSGNDDDDNDDDDDDDDRGMSVMQTVDLRQYIQTAKPGLLVIGRYSSSSSFNIIIAVDNAPTLVYNTSQDTTYIVNRQAMNFLEGELDMNRLFSGITSAEIERAQRIVYRGELVLFVHRQFNTQLYTKVLTNLSKAGTVRLDVKEENLN